MRTGPVATLISEGTALDAFTGRLTAFNMLESLLVPALPAMLPKLVVTTMYELGAESRRFFERIRMIDPDGNDLLVSGPTILELACRQKGDVPNVHRSFHVLSGMRIAHHGEHTVVVEHGDLKEGPWTEVAMRSLVAVQGQHPFSPRPGAGKMADESEERASTPK